MWNKNLVEKLKQIGFVASQIDECLLFYKQGQSVFVLYTDALILAGPDYKELGSIIEVIKKAELDLTVEGDIVDFLGVKIEMSPDGRSFSLTQPHLIEDTIKKLILDSEKTAIKQTTGALSKPFLRNPTAEPFNGHFDYCRVIRRLKYLELCTRIDITCATHQAMRNKICE